MRKLTMYVLAATLLAGTVQAKTIGLAVANANDTFQHSLVDAVAKAVAANSGTSLKTLDAAKDGAKQLSQIKDLIGAKVDSLIIGLVDSDMGAEISKLASNANIPVIFVNNMPANFDLLPANEAFVSSDETTGGTLQAKEVCRLLNGKGKAAILMGQLYHDGARKRTTIVQQFFSQPPCDGIEVVESQSANWSASQAETVVDEWLKAGVKFDAILANNDEMALGAIASLKKHDIAKSKVVVAGIDATPAALKSMAQGDLDVTILQNAAVIGQDAVDKAIKLSNGQKVEKQSSIPFELITPSNMEKYIAKSE